MQKLIEENNDCHWVRVLYQLWLKAQRRNPFLVGLDFSSSAHKMFSSNSLKGLSGENMQVLFDAMQVMLDDKAPDAPLIARVRVILAVLMEEKLRRLLISGVSVAEQAQCMQFIFVLEPRGTET